MKRFCVVHVLLLASTVLGTAAVASDPIVDANVVFAEQDGLVAIEAEHFFKQELTEKRAWYLHSSESVSDVSPDGDPAHVAGAAGGAYLEILPDTRRTHADKLIKGENFSNEPGKLAVLSYKVKFENPGRYYVWVRAYSTGSEDNGIHVGLNGEWPESGRRMQWCQGKQQWRWESKQRTAEQHCGVPHQIYLDIPEAGEHQVSISLREDGFEMDRFLLTQDREFSRPVGIGPAVKLAAGEMPKPFAYVEPAAGDQPVPEQISSLRIEAKQLMQGSEGYYLQNNRWLAINPDVRQEASTTTAFPFPSGKYDLTLHAVGEEDGQATYRVLKNDELVGEFTCPLSEQQFEEGPKFNQQWRALEIDSGDVLRIESKVASEDGQEFSRARVAGLAFVAADETTRLAVAQLNKPTPAPVEMELREPLVEPRQADGDGSVSVSGELQQWHKITLTLDGPFAHELDNEPNAFLDYALTATFRRQGGRKTYTVPGYFAADGQAGESSARAGTKWRVHFAPDEPGTWDYKINFASGDDVAIGGDGKSLDQFCSEGSFEVAESDKTGVDFRGRGRLTYVGEHYLQFAGSKEYFLKAGPDAPETLLAYEDFDDTRTLKPGKGPLKNWAPHIGDWKDGDPTWKDGKGKGLIGALNYLSSKGCNSFSFLPYNAGGDGDNVWPFVDRNEKLNYDCSKLDQWGIVFDHATQLGLYLHFKLQENEIDDNRRGHEAKSGVVPESLDGGKLGVQRKLYCRELIARFGHALALNWNIGEENTQSPEEQRAMISYLKEVDPYDHLIVIHTFPNQQDKVYPELLGRKSQLTGASLQNSWSAAHARTLKWRRASAKAGRAWVVCNDEQNPASDGVPPDPGYQGHDGYAEQNGKKYNLDDVRKQCLWGTLMAGGAGVEYYFGYKLPENDLVCQDFRSRDRSWDYCRYALDFFRDNEIPLSEMRCIDALAGGDAEYCFAKPGSLYLVYLPSGGTSSIAVSDIEGYQLHWFNPRTGGELQTGELSIAGTQLEFSAPDEEDWLAVIRKAP